MLMIVYSRETPPHIRTARAQPEAAHVVIGVVEVVVVVVVTAVAVYAFVFVF